LIEYFTIAFTILTFFVKNNASRLKGFKEEGRRRRRRKRLSVLYNKGKIDVYLFQQKKIQSKPGIEPRTYTSLD
jgi:hypothetical protein